jgi:hypothetical protein
MSGFLSEWTVRSGLKMETGDSNPMQLSRQITKIEARIVGAGFGITQTVGYPATSALLPSVPAGKSEVGFTSCEAALPNQ